MSNVPTAACPPLRMLANARHRTTRMQRHSGLRMEAGGVSHLGLVLLRLCTQAVNPQFQVATTPYNDLENYTREECSRGRRELHPSHPATTFPARPSWDNNRSPSEMRTISKGQPSRRRSKEA